MSGLSSEGGVTLDQDEAAAIARRLAAQTIRMEANDQWEDVPNLAEDSWLQVWSHMQSIADDLDKRAAATGQNVDRLWLEATE